MGLTDSITSAIGNVADPLLRSGGSPAFNQPTATQTPGQQDLLSQLVQALGGQIGQPGQVFQGELPGASRAGVSVRLRA